MARMVGRAQTSPLPKSNQSSAKLATSASINEENDSESDSSSIMSYQSTAASGKKRASSGRAGMVRQSTVPAAFTTSGAHSAALGRGHSNIAMMQQNFRPFLDESYFVTRADVSGPNSIIGSHISVESSVSRTNTTGSTGSGNHLIFLDVEVFLHEDTAITSVSQKTLGFDVRQTVKNVMNEISSYLDVENAKPLYFLCKNTGAKLEDGTLSSNKIETEFVFEFHVMKDKIVVDDGVNTTKTQDRTFAQRYNTNSIYLALILFNTEKRILVNANGMIPSVEVSNEPNIVENFGYENKEFLWAKTKSEDYEVPYLDAINMGHDEDFVFNVQALEKNIKSLEATVNLAHSTKLNSPSLKSLKFKMNFLIACLKLCETLKLNKLGFMHYKPVKISNVNNAHLMVALQFNSLDIDSEVLKEHGFKWKNYKNLQPNFYNIADDEIWALYFNYYQRTKSILAPGVYVGLFHVKNTTDTLSIFSLKHDPDLIPLTRLRGGHGGTLTMSDHSTSTTTSSISINKTATTDLLTSEEIDYIRYLSEKEYNPVELPPAGLKITKQLEGFGNQVKTCIKVLSSQCGLKDIDLSHMSLLSPINFGPNVQVLVIAPTDDLQTQSSPTKEKSGGILNKFSKIGLGKVQEESAKEEEYNRDFFSYIPIALFETLHHHNYNEAGYCGYRRTVDILNTDQLRVEVGDDKNLKFAEMPMVMLKSSSSTASNCSGAGLMKSGTSATSSFDGGQSAAGAQGNTVLQRIIGQLNECKKQWNATQSWVLRIIQRNRQVMMERKIEAARYQ